jgi:thiamine pyrophosphokinase
MSSHHIVREDQEPALIIANGEDCSTELMGQLLEWSPLVIALDSAVERILSLGIKIDVILGDFDRDFDPQVYLQSQYPLEIVHTPNQDKTDLEKSFDFLIDRGHKAANVVWATGRRTDHTLANLSVLAKYKNLLKINIIDDYSRVYCLPQKFEKWFTKGSILSLMPVGTVEGISTQNLKYPLQNESLILGYRNGNSNEVLADGLVCISHAQGDLLLMECHD